VSFAFPPQSVGEAPLQDATRHRQRKANNVSTTNGGNRRWKRQEQSIARALGTSPIASNGTRRSDMEADQFGVEVKTMKALPVRLRKAMEQSIEACEKTSKVPVVVLNQPRIGKKPLRFVVMRFEDWQLNNAPRGASQIG
jgi:hypothetical protein